MKKNILFLVALLTCATLYAQTPNYYVVEETTGNYTELKNDTLVSGAFTGGPATWMLELSGDKFSLFGKQYDLDNTNRHIVFSNNGFLRVEDDSTFIVIDAMFTGSDSIDSDSKVSYVMDGNPGNRRIKIQWKNLSLTNGPAGNYVNYQIWYHQLTGIFELHYGASSANNKSGYTTSSGPNVGLFYSLKDFTKMFEKLWFNGAPGSYVIDSSRITGFKAVSGVPPEGTIIKFIPKSYQLRTKDVERTGKILVAPNPADDLIMIKGEQRFNKGTTVLLTDMLGRSMQEFTLTNDSKDITINTTEMPEGLYHLSVGHTSNATAYTVLIAHH